MPEILGFSPQLLLDDIINEANLAIIECVDAVEVFLERWADDRAARVGETWDGYMEIEQVSASLVVVCCLATLTTQYFHRR